MAEEEGVAEWAGDDNEDGASSVAAADVDGEEEDEEEAEDGGSGNDDDESAPGSSETGSPQQLTKKEDGAKQKLAGAAAHVHPHPPAPAGRQLPAGRTQAVVGAAVRQPAVVVEPRYQPAHDVELKRRYRNHRRGAELEEFRRRAEETRTLGPQGRAGATALRVRAFTEWSEGGNEGMLRGRDFYEPSPPDRARVAEARLHHDLTGFGSSDTRGLARDKPAAAAAAAMAAATSGTPVRIGVSGMGMGAGRGAQQVRVAVGGGERAGGAQRRPPQGGRQYYPNRGKAGVRDSPEEPSALFFTGPAHAAKLADFTEPDDPQRRLPAAAKPAREPLPELSAPAHSIASLTSGAGAATTEPFLPPLPGSSSPAAAAAAPAEGRLVYPTIPGALPSAEPRALERAAQRLLERRDRCISSLATLVRKLDAPAAQQQQLQQLQQEPHVSARRALLRSLTEAVVLVRTATIAAVEAIRKCCDTLFVVGTSMGDSAGAMGGESSGESSVEQIGERWRGLLTDMAWRHQLAHIARGSALAALDASPAFVMWLGSPLARPPGYAFRDEPRLPCNVFLLPRPDSVEPRGQANSALLRGPPRLTRTWQTRVAEAGAILYDALAIVDGVHSDVALGGAGADVGTDGLMALSAAEQRNVEEHTLQMLAEIDELRSELEYGAALSIQCQVRARQARQRVALLKSAKAQPIVGSVNQHRGPATEPADRHASATRIQCMARRRSAARRVAGLRAARSAAFPGVAPSCGIVGTQLESTDHPPLLTHDRHANATRIQCMARRRSAARRVAGLRAARSAAVHPPG
jgi:hypothetical protein